MIESLRYASYSLRSDISLGVQTNLRYVQGDCDEIHVKHGNRWHRVPRGGVVIGVRAEMLVRSAYPWRNCEITISTGQGAYVEIPDVVAETGIDDFTAVYGYTNNQHAALISDYPFEVEYNINREFYLFGKTKEIIEEEEASTLTAKFVARQAVPPITAKKVEITGAYVAEDRLRLSSNNKVIVHPHNALLMKHLTGVIYLKGRMLARSINAT